MFTRLIRNNYFRIILKIELWAQCRLRISSGGLVGVGLIRRRGGGVMQHGYFRGANMNNVQEGNKQYMYHCYRTV